MKLSIRSIVTGLLATFIFALPLSQADAGIIHSNYGSQQQHYGPSNQDQHKQKEQNNWSENDKDLLYKKIVREDFEQHHDFNDGCKRDCGKNQPPPEPYCSCKGKKCDNDHNVPEPTPLALLGLGLGVIGLVRRFVPSRRS
jgi:hypothetical protein